MALAMGAVDREVSESIRQFLYCESRALDERRFRDWLTAFADDARYEMPVRVTREKLADWEVSPTSRIFDDTKRTLEIRVQRLETDFAWAEQPPSRTRHFVTNVIVEPTDDSDEFNVSSNCLVYRSRGSEPNPSFFSAARTDLIRRVGNGWVIVTRWVVLDQSLINANNMSIFI